MVVIQEKRLYVIPKPSNDLYSIRGVDTVNSEYFCEGFVFAKLRICEVSRKQNPRKFEITLSFTDVGKSCCSRELLRLQISTLMIFAKISKFTVYDA